MRKTADIVIDAPGRDAGKSFRLTEMSSYQAEAWATRALMAAYQEQVDVPDELLNGGMAGLAILGIQTILRIPYELARPLLDEMMGCVQVVPDPTRPMVARALLPDDVEEVSTILRLRVEVFNLHVGFSEPGAAWTSLREMMQAMPGLGPNTSTSTQPSGRSSRRAKRR